jgi:ABC-type uncharacterized transport system substrate-binding protein
VKRRAFISLLGGAVAAWPLAVRAQQPAIPVVGFLDSRLPDAITDRLRAFRQGLKDVGYVEGENLAIVYRLANNQDDRLPELAADLARRGVAMIATAGTPSTFAAKAADFIVGNPVSAERRHRLANASRSHATFLRACRKRRSCWIRYCQTRTTPDRYPLAQP